MSQECRAQASQRHPQDCLICSHGYHFLHEQNLTDAILPNATTSAVMYSSGSFVVDGEETGYCFRTNFF